LSTHNKRILYCIVLDCTDETHRKVFPIFGRSLASSRIKNLLNSNISSTYLHNMVNFGPLAAEMGLPVWGTPANFNAFFMLASLLHRCRSKEVNQTFQSLRRGTRNGITELSQRAPPTFARAAITLGIGPHSSYGRPM